jgi:glutaredoxin 3
MAEVTVYSTAYCPYCHAAKDLLAKMEVAFTEIDLTGQPGERARLTDSAAGRSTVPQIFIDGKAIGGFDELVALKASGELAELLGQA